MIRLAGLLFTALAYVPAAFAVDRLGWVRLPGGGEALVVPAAHGGLRMLDPGSDYWAEDWVLSEHALRRQPFHRVSPGEWEITPIRTEDGTLTAWHWKNAQGQTQAARPIQGPYSVEELDYRNGEVNLAATLFVPSSPGPHAFAVIVHGSGTSDRDNLWYMQIIHRVVISGVAVLFPDKRGSGESGGDWQEASLWDLAEDARTGLAAVGSDPRLDSKRAGVIGISQGGHIAPMIAVADPELAFVVNLVGGAVTLNESLEHETLQTLQHEYGMSIATAKDMLPTAIGMAKSRKPGFWRRNGYIDPADFWEKVRQPSLAIYGRGDEQDNVPVSISVERLELADSKDGMRQIEVQVFDGIGHDLRDPGEHMIRKDVFERLLDFLRTHAKRHSTEPAPGGA